MNYDNWKSTLPEDSEWVEPGIRDVPLYDPYDVRKLDSRLIRAGFDPEPILKIVAEWLLGHEEIWKRTQDEQALRFANSLKVIRECHLRNGGGR